MWYCLQAHNVTVRAGALSSTIVDEWSKVEADPGGDSSGAGTNLTFVDIPESFNVEANDVYGLGPNQMAGITRYTNEVLRGRVNGDGSASAVDPTTTFVEGLQANSDSIHGWIDRFAHSMSNEVRLTGGRIDGSESKGDSRYAGLIYSTQVTIVVRWGWLAFPAALVLLSIAFLAIETIRTVYNGAEAWKQDDPLPLCIQMDDSEPIAQATQGLGEPGGLRKHIGDYRVGLRRRGTNGLEGPLELARAGSS